MGLAMRAIKIALLVVSIAVWGAVPPGCAGPRLYWGDVHGHTASSDGKGTVEDYFRYARDEAGLDFVIVTDHDFGNGPPWRMPVETWRRTEELADAFTVAGSFVAIAGYEWTSQPKYWSGNAGESEHLFDGPARCYNHKNVYFPRPVPYLFSAKDEHFQSPDLLARAVREVGGLIHNNHPDAGPGGRDQWDYDAASAEVIRNTEIGADVVRYEGRKYETRTESTVRAYLDSGGRTGFVCASDTHEGRPAARTAVYASALTRDAVFDALRRRRCYGVSGARIDLDFRIDGHWMGEEFAARGAPTISIDVRAPAPIDEIVLVRNGAILLTRRPGSRRARVEQLDESFEGDSYYYVRVTLADADQDGNPSRAWSSPIWVSDERSR
jgi:Protein of unknown function (DUF3604)